MTAKLSVRRIKVDLRDKMQATIPAWVLDSGKPGPGLLLTAAHRALTVTWPFPDTIPT